MFQLLKTMQRLKNMLSKYPLFSAEEKDRKIQIKNGLVSNAEKICYCRHLIDFVHFTVCKLHPKNLKLEYKISKFHADVLITDGR